MCDDSSAKLNTGCVEQLYFNHSFIQTDIQNKKHENDAKCRRRVSQLVVKNGTIFTDYFPDLFIDQFLH